MCGLVIQFTATTFVNKCPISAGFSLAKKSTPVSTNRAKQRIPRDLASSFCLSGTLGGGMASLAAHEKPLCRSRGLQTKPADLPDAKARTIRRSHSCRIVGWLTHADVCYPLVMTNILLLKMAHRNSMK